MSRTKKTAGVSAEKVAVARGDGVTEPSSDEIIARARAEAYSDKDPARAFAHFRSIAEGVSTEGIAVFTGRPMVMLANVNAALVALAPALPRAVEQLRAPRLREVFEIPSLVLGLEFASQRVPATKMSAGEIAALFDEMSPLRAVTLDYLTVASNPLVQLVPETRVRTIREGAGKLDGAQDAVAIPGVFHEFATALEGKHPFTAAQLARLGELGAALLQQLKPGGATKGTSARPPEAVLRDQFGALVVERYDYLLVLAALALGKARADALLPALRSATHTATAVVADTPADPTKPTG